jgi:hypothetical protein
LAQGEGALEAVYPAILADAQRRLGRLWNAAEYPVQVRGLFRLDWDFPAVEPPDFLMLRPQIYEEQCRRVAARFEEAVQLAEQAFITEFSRLLAHLTERLANDDQGERQTFRNSAVGNLREFFQRFSHLNVRSNPELDALVAQAQQLVEGVGPQDLRDDNSLRQRIATQMATVQAQVESLMVTPPRRRILRARPSPNGGPNGSAH